MVSQHKKHKIKQRQKKLQKAKNIRRNNPERIRVPVSLKKVEAPEMTVVMDHKTGKPRKVTVLKDGEPVYRFSHFEVIYNKVPKNKETMAYKKMMEERISTEENRLRSQKEVE